MSGSTVPPLLNQCIAMVCNGKLDEDIKDLREKISNCRQIIGVDGGLDHCDRLGLIPHLIIGDFDSANLDTLKKFSQIKQQRLEKTKDLSDLEVAIQKTETSTQIVIFGGLGGRLDHTLANLFLLLKYPTRLFLETDQQLIFGLSAKSPIEIQNGIWNSFALLPLYGAAKGVNIRSNGRVYNFTVDRSQERFFPLNNSTNLTIQEGELIVLLSKKNPSEICKNLSDFLTILKSENAADEQILHIKSGKEISIECSIGTTISLMPFYGPVTGIKSTGLGWELGEKITELNKNQVVLSNVAMQSPFTIAIEGGELLCIINRKIIDLDMVQKLKSS